MGRAAQAVLYRPQRDRRYSSSSLKIARYCALKSMAQFPIGVGVVGTGFGRKIHIPGFRAHPRTQVVAVYHRNLETAEAIAAEYDIPKAYSQVQALAQDPDVQAISIATPPFLHYEMVSICC